MRGPTTHRPGTWCTTPSQSRAGSRSPQMVTRSWFPFAWSCRVTPLARLGFQCRGRSPGRSRCRRVPSSCRRPASCGSHRGCHSRAFARSSAPEAQPRVAPYRAAILVLRKRAQKVNSVVTKWLQTAVLVPDRAARRHLPYHARTAEVSGPSSGRTVGKPERCVRESLSMSRA